MKNLFGILMLLVFVAGASYAAESTSANGEAKAKIVAAAEIEHQDGALDFGSIFKNTTGGTVTIANAAAPAPSYSGVTPAASGAPSSDHFVMSNLDPATPYQVAFASASITIQKQGGSETMPVALTLSDTSVTGVATKDIYVGGTLTVGPNQAEGQYEGSYTVNVTY